MKFFLGLGVARSDFGIFLNQRVYILDMFSDVGLPGCKPSPLPMQTGHMLSLSQSDLVADPTQYCHHVEQLIYLCVTYAVHIMSQLMASPRHEVMIMCHIMTQLTKCSSF